eukprot:34947-Pelagomonas_calceolata.AAC.5
MATSMIWRQKESTFAHSTQVYLQAKQARMNHLLEERQSCFWNHEGEPALPSIATQAKQKGVRTGIQLPDLSPATSSSSTIPLNGGNGTIQSSQQQQ